MIDIKHNKNNFDEIKDVKSICLWGDENCSSQEFLTICIPTYKRADLLKRAISSALKQETCLPYKVLVIDNDDDFNEKEILYFIQSLNDSKLVYFKNQKNIGMAGNWNRCGELVHTKYFALLHDDDILLSNYIQNIYKYTEKNKYDFIFPGYEQINNPFFKTNTNKDRIIKKIFFRYKTVKIKPIANLFIHSNTNGAPSCGVVLSTEAFRNSGGFDANYYPSMDWVYFVFCNINYSCIKIRKKLAEYYWYENTSLKPEVLNGFTKQREEVIKAIFKTNRLYKVLELLFYNDFKSIYTSDITEDYGKKISFIFRCIQKYLTLKYTGFVE